MSIYLSMFMSSIPCIFPYRFNLILLNVHITSTSVPNPDIRHPLFRGETWSSRTVFPVHPNAAVPDVIRADHRSREHLYLTKKCIHSPTSNFYQLTQIDPHIYGTPVSPLPSRGTLLHPGKRYSASVVISRESSISRSSVD